MKQLSTGSGLGLLTLVREGQTFWPRTESEKKSSSKKKEGSGKTNASSNITQHEKSVDAWSCKLE